MRDTLIDWQPLHGRYLGGLIPSAMLHTCASMCFARAATSGNSEVLAHRRRQAGIRACFAAMEAATKFARTGESLEAWLARDGQIEYLGDLFFHLLLPEPEPRDETGTTEEDGNGDA